jgi:hypothetical protein
MFTGSSTSLHIMDRPGPSASSGRLHCSTWVDRCAALCAYALGSEQFGRGRRRRLRLVQERRYMTVLIEVRAIRDARTRTGPGEPELPWKFNFTGSGAHSRPFPAQCPGRACDGHAGPKVPPGPGEWPSGPAGRRAGQSQPRARIQRPWGYSSWLRVPLRVCRRQAALRVPSCVPGNLKGLEPEGPLRYLWLALPWHVAVVHA